MKVLVDQNVISKHVLMFYETFDMINLLKLLFTNPQHVLVWISKLGTAKWIIIAIIVAF
jgi:hypothetical protein